MTDILKRQPRARRSRQAASNDVPPGRVFLSYNSKDVSLAETLAEGLRPAIDRELFFAPRHLVAGRFWQPALADEIGTASGFILLVGENGIGPWQVQEYYAANDRKVKEPAFPLLVVLLKGKPAPGLPFINQLHWTVTDDPAGSDTVGLLRAGLAGAAGRPTERWRHTEPYRSLLAMTENDSAYFFGRDAETTTVIETLAQDPNRLPVLVGNSGVGKSSVAQAGVVAALKRESFPGANPPAWPQHFRDSRRWAYLTMRPGRDPLAALVESFFNVWNLDPRDPDTHTLRDKWIDDIRAGRHGLRALLDAATQHLAGSARERLPGVFLYVDQGEELYVRSFAESRMRFSEVLAAGLGNERLCAVMSLRADYLGELQKDAPLFRVHDLVQVAPLDEPALRDVVARPAGLLGARLEMPELADKLAHRAHEESAKDSGALPLLSYLLHDMWAAMIARGDGTLRLSGATVDLGGVLAERADRYLQKRPEDETALRRILTLKLATVREGREPTRQQARRSDFTDHEWPIVCGLADHPHRLLAVSNSSDGEPTAEVAHEALFRHWQRLKGWISEEKDFLTWRTGLTDLRLAWNKLPEAGREDGLLRGFPLRQAETWLTRRDSGDLSRADHDFVAMSLASETARKNTEEARRLDEERQRAERESERAERERERADTQALLAEHERARAETQALLAEEERRRADKQTQAAKENRRLYRFSRAIGIVAVVMCCLSAFFWREADKARAREAEAAGGARAAAEREAAAAAAATVAAASAQRSAGLAQQERLKAEKAAAEAKDKAAEAEKQKAIAQDAIAQANLVACDDQTSFRFDGDRDDRRRAWQDNMDSVDIADIRQKCEAAFKVSRTVKERRRLLVQLGRLDAENGKRWALQNNEPAAKIEFLRAEGRWKDAADLESGQASAVLSAFYRGKYDVELKSGRTLKVAENFPEAFRRAEQSADRKNQTGMTILALAKLYPSLFRRPAGAKDERGAIAVLRSIDTNVPDRDYVIGLARFDGLGGLKKEEDKGRRLIERAECRGSLQAKFWVLKSKDSSASLCGDLNEDPLDQ